MDRDQGTPDGNERGGIGAGSPRELLAQGHDRQEAEDADRDDGRFHDPRGDIAKGDDVVLPLEERIEHDGGADIGDHQDDFQERPQRHLPVRAGTDDVGGVIQHRGVENKRRRDGGDERDQEEPARHGGNRSRRGHVDSFLDDVGAVLRYVRTKRCRSQGASSLHVRCGRPPPGPRRLYSWDPESTLSSVRHNMVEFSPLIALPPRRDHLRHAVRETLAAATARTCQKRRSSCPHGPQVPGRSWIPRRRRVSGCAGCRPFSAFLVGGLIAIAVTGPVTSLTNALIGGAVAGAVLGAAQWLALRGRLSKTEWWIPATAVGQAVGLAAGAALVGYRTGLQDLAIQGAITGLGVGILQALVLRPHVATWFWWAIAMPPLWALGWIVTTRGWDQGRPALHELRRQRRHRRHDPQRSPPGAAAACPAPDR